MMRTGVKVLVWLGVLAGAVGFASTTWTVMTNGDTPAGTCNVNNNECTTLRAALEDADVVIELIQSGDTITFAASLAGQTITLTSGLPNIPVDNLTIDASSLTDKVTIQGANTYRIFRHTGKGTFTINNLVVTGGRPYVQGGGINSNGNVIITNSTISDNLGEGYGGGIRSAGNVTITGSTISNNTVEPEGSNSAGGGIHSNGDVTVTDSTISDNTASLLGGGINSVGDVTVTNSTISGNKAVTNGGGIRSNGNVTVTDSAISGNEAADGGGINSLGNVTVTDSTISGNTAQGGRGGGSGGGISSMANLTLSGCSTIENNTAETGAQWFLNGGTSTVTDNNDIVESTATTYDDPYIGCPASSGGGSVINPDPDMQIRNGATTAAASITSGSVVNIGAFKRGEVATVDFLIRNPGAQVLELGELSLPSFLSNAGEPLPETLVSFGSALLTLSVDTSAAGALEGAFSLASNDPDAFENPFVFTVKGSVSDTPANALNILPGIDLGDISAAAGEDNVVLLSFKLLVPAGSTSVTVDSLTLAASNAGIERASNLRLYIDGGTRGELDNRDVFLSSTTDTTNLTFTFPARTFSPNVPMWFVVVGDF